MEKAAVLGKQKWRHWPQTNEACVKVAAFPIAGAKFPLLHLHSPYYAVPGLRRVPHMGLVSELMNPRKAKGTEPSSYTAEM